MFSMTGYGKGEYKEGGIELTVEIKTVNNRYLDVSVKAPRIFTACEEAIRAKVRGSMTRGHADVYVNLTDRRERAKTLYVDEEAARSWYHSRRFHPHRPSEVYRRRPSRRGAGGGRRTLFRSERGALRRA